ncbi:molybdopterin-dependent oxidoreductase [Desulfogranum mediterraneum]|uniref:molybdopterin-dependent oxidoreductase n=1 Tax=Desulfogranum mediterraneum TaxID=160661 RepID=UPI000403DA4F|nr:molybdopterin-dependent oxidoreductase [Desulfogranum mediterraneum]
MKQSVYSMCGMCTVRCPIRVESEDNQVTWIEGNPHLLGGALCAKGTAGVALVNDSQRPQSPLIRVGARGAGRWREAGWDEALDYIAAKLKTIKQTHGPESVVLSSRGGPWQGMYKAFIHAFGSPNYTNHDCTCGRNTHHASLSINGVGRKGFGYDIRNARHLVLFGRDMFSALRIAENHQTLDMLDKGGRLTYVDVRQTMTGAKASRFFQIRPGTDYALALGLIHEVIKRGYYDQDFLDRYVSGFDELCSFIEAYTPAWAAKECNIREKELLAFVDEIGEDRPGVIFHPGWNLARYRDSFYASRAMHILNVLMGNIELKGGLFIPKGAADCGLPGIRSIDCAKPDIKRGDGVGWQYTHFDKGPGLAHLFFNNMLKEDPYPIKAWIAMRHDPFSGMPDPQQQKLAFDKCELLVSIDTNYSEYGWYSDVILPESTYLERDTPIVQQKGLKPRLAVRRKAVEPRYDTRASWEIFTGLAHRLGLEATFPFTTIEELWAWQLEPTGHTMADFEEKGFVELIDQPLWHDRDQLDSTFKTPSGRIELVSEKLTKAGLPSLKPFEKPEAAEKGMFRLIYGKVAVHTQGHTTNNPMLSELMPTNTAWINTKQAKKLGIQTGDQVELSSADHSYNATVAAQVTDHVHPEAVFTVHGFGKEIPRQRRSFLAGVSDQKLMVGALDDWDQAGGGISLCEVFVHVKKSIRNTTRRAEL